MKASKLRTPRNYSKLMMAQQNLPPFFVISVDMKRWALIGLTPLFSAEKAGKWRTGLGMCSPGSQLRIFSLRDTSLPVIVGIVLIINIGILTGVSRFG